MVSLNSTENKQIRKFGIVALIFFGCLSALGLLTQKALPTYFFGSLCVLGLGFILIPRPLRPIYATWLKTAHILGTVVTTLILALAYYVVITPAGVIKRFFSGPPFPLKPDKNASSYWVTRTEPAQSKERFLKRY